MANKKIGFLSLTLALMLASNNVCAVDEIRPEDEDIVKDLLSAQEPKETPQKIRKATLPITHNYSYKPNAPRKADWFDPAELPSNKQKTSADKDPRVAELKNAINDCLNFRRQQLELERDMVKQAPSTDNIAYLTQTFEAINFCYEDIGYDILQTYYHADKQAYDNFKTQAKTFYVSGADVSFNPLYCEENCSIEALIDSQLVKFGEFRVYLNELLDNRPLKE